MTQTGTLYIVATPIGNLEDISARALKILNDVDVIAAEDTRQSRKLLQRHAINTPLLAYHQYNQSNVTVKLLERLQAGAQIALVSDAGTPLISDPGETLVASAHQLSIKVVPIPGASALSSALSVCGFRVNPMHFEGFLPTRRMARIERLKALQPLSTALVFFEAPHRIADSLQDMLQTLGEKRHACIAREMTKLHEQILVGTLKAVRHFYIDNSQHRKGEFVVIIAPPVELQHEINTDAVRTLTILLEELSARKAAELAARIHGVGRNALYRLTLQMQAEQGSNSTPSH